MLPSPLHKGHKALYIRLGRSSEAAKGLFARRCGTSRRRDRALSGITQAVAVAGSGVAHFVEHLLCKTVRFASVAPRC